MIGRCACDRRAGAAVVRTVPVGEKVRQAAGLHVQRDHEEAQLSSEIPMLDPIVSYPQAGSLESIT